MQLMKSKLLKIIELSLLFILFPILYYLQFIPGPKLLLLLIIVATVLIYLLRSRSFNRRELGFNGFSEWRGMIIRICIGSVIITLLTVLILPDYLFYLPRKSPRLWVLVLFMYPVWSAFTQELIYRTFFFFRYGDLFPGDTAAAIANGVLFGFLHIIFNNWIAVIGATTVGLLWAFLYKENRSLMAISLEHAIFGDLIFTIGLGHYFYIPDFYL